MAAWLALALALPACSTLDGVATAVGGGPTPQAGQAGFVRGFLGGVVAEEPRAALIGRNVLSTGGSAADAAVAAGLALTVTMPSRAGLGGGGACLVFIPASNTVESIVFTAGARAAVPPGADRPAAVPMMARGLFALHARAGRRPFEELVVPAEQAARFGAEISRAFAGDLAAVSGPLLADPAAAAIFAGPNGRPLQAGERLTQVDLGGTLAALRTAGVGDFYQGGLARRMEESSAAAGGSLTVAELRASVPRVVPASQVASGTDMVSFLPREVDGGAAAAAFAAAQGGATPAPAGGMLPASTGLVALDRDGMAVSCAFSMNNLFGTGRVAPGTGVLLAAAPGIGQVQPAPLAAALVTSPNTGSFRAAVAGSGQEAAPLAVAVPLARLLRGADAASAAASAPEPGRTQLMSCPRYLPGNASSCEGATDPRGAGLSIGAVDR